MSNVIRLMIAIFASFCVAGIVAQSRCSAPNMTPLLYIYRSKNGSTTVQTSYKDGDWLFFRCKNNGQLVGSSLRRCTSGAWTGTTPVCIPKATVAPPVRCKNLRSLKHGKIRGRRRVNAIVTFTCSAGYNIMGPKKLKCLPTGKWSGQVPRCLKDVSCPDPGTLLNGVRDGRKFKYGRRVKYSCNTGYKLVGSVLRKCMSTGKWSGKRAKCVKMDPASELKEVADNLRKNMVNKFGLVTQDSRARSSGIASGASGLDFVFVLDSSASVGQTNFRRGVQFVETIIKEHGVSTKPQGTRVAIVTFNAAAEVKFNLATNVMKDTKQAMKELGNIHFKGGGTNTEAALSKVYHDVAPEARNGSHKVLFLITDGRSNAGTNPRHYAKRLKKKNYEIFTIGITKNADKNELRSIASQPYKSHIHLLADYATLEKLKDMITGKGNDTWECGQAGDTGLREKLKIPNRKLAKDDAWPWQAVIYVNAAFQCGGTLVADNWVLTAASCFDRKVFTNHTGHNIEVVLGEHNRFESGGTEQTKKVEKLIRPSKSGKKRLGDIVMVKLKSPIKPTSYAHAVCYDEDPDSSLIWPAQYGVVTGWGSKKKINNTVTIPALDEPWQTVVKFVSDRDCREKLNIKRLRETLFCGSSQDDSVKKCLGDTGGPVVVKLIDDSWTLVGVMKNNEGCTPGSKYSLFIKVGYYSAWITETILKQ